MIINNKTNSKIIKRRISKWKVKMNNNKISGIKMVHSIISSQIIVRTFSNSSITMEMNRMSQNNKNNINLYKLSRNLLHLLQKRPKRRLRRLKHVQRSLLQSGRINPRTHSSWNHLLPKTSSPLWTKAKSIKWVMYKKALSTTPIVLRLYPTVLQKC